MQQPTSDHRGAEFFGSLEGMRGLAAVGVVFYHTYWHWQLNNISFVRHSQLFVDLFFVISGFVISHIYTARLRSPNDFLAFTLLRTARLYPLHLFTLLLIAGYTAATTWAAGQWQLPIGIGQSEGLNGNNLRHFVNNLLLVQALPLHHGYSFNRPSWSISTEYFTYFIFAVVALLAYGRKWVLYPLLAGLALLPAAYLWSKGGLAVDLNMPRCLAGFFTGTLVQLLWRRVHGRLRPRLAGGAVTHLVEIACLAAIVLALTFCGNDLGEFVVIPVFALAVLVFSMSRGAVVRVLESRMVQALGKWSYSIYMLHFSVILVFTDLTRVFTGGTVRQLGLSPLQSLAWTAALLATVFVLARLTYACIEVPPRSWAKRWLAAHELGL